MLLPISSTWRQAGGYLRIRRLFLVVALFAMTTVALGAEPEPDVKVTEAAGVYTVAATFAVQQSAAASMAVLTDYEHLARFMPGLRKSTVVARTGDRVTVEQEADAKLLAFSKRICLLLDIEESPLSLRFVDKSGKSFIRYEGSWRLAAENGRTRITYALVAKPAFSVPEFLLTRLLRRDSGRMIAALQAEIAARATRPPEAK